MTLLAPTSEANPKSAAGRESENLIAMTPDIEESEGNMVVKQNERVEGGRVES